LSSLPAKERERLVKAAEAAQKLIKRYEDIPMLGYHPCCATHGGRKPDDWPLDKVWTATKCPAYPCPESKHMRFHSSRARIRFVLGGNRSAKTFTCTQEFLIRMTFKKHPFTGEVFRQGPRYGRILAQDYAIHEKKHVDEIKKWIPKQALKGRDAATRADAWEQSYDSRNHILHLANGGWIDFLTYDQDPSKGESVDLDVWFADEEIPEEWYDACNSRIVSTRGIGIMGVTPLYGLSWSIRLFDSIDPNIEKFQWSIWDNPHNSAQSITDFLAQASEGTRESRETGALMDFKGLRYKQLRPEAHLLDVEKAQPNPFWPVVCAVDPHQRKGTFVTWAYVDPYDTVVFFDELQIQGTPKEVVSVIRQRERTHKAITQLRVIDPAADKQVEGYGEDISTLDMFEKEGMAFTLGFNGNAGYGVVEEYLNYDATKPIDTNNSPRCKFSRACERTWYSMTRLMWDEWRPGARSQREAKERVRDKGKDFPDCVRYTLTTNPSFSSQNYEPVNINFNL
jgi:phage terminase large subunit-like protein